VRVPGPRVKLGVAWLDVPFAEIERAKRLGARFDGQAKRWYAPPGTWPRLGRWHPLPERIPGEDRQFGQGLFVDLIPRTSWFVNIRSAVSETDWYRIRRMSYRRAGNRCEACSAPAENASGRGLECHERFRYHGRVQRVCRLICLCERCHATTHFGLAQRRGEEALVLAHLRSVTGMSRAQADEHVRGAFELWERRNQITWSVDVSMIGDLGVAIRRSAA
jgi:Domain of unknown function (DUF5710)